MLNMEDLYRLLRTGHVQAQGIVDTIEEPLLVLDASLCVQSASRAFFETFGVERDETIGQRIYELGNGQWDIPELRLLLEKVIPKATAIINYEVQHDFPKLGPRTMLLTARTLNHPDNISHSLLLAIVDVTDQRGREDAKDMLFGELRHRMKNVLGVAQSLARQTPVDGISAEEYRDTFLGRFSALIDAQDVAFSEQEDVGLSGLLERILAPYSTNPDAVVIDIGPPVVLNPRTIMSLGLILHELATNAVRHGALSVPAGRVRVSWTLDEAVGQLRLKWKESGGPLVERPETTGYGSRLIHFTTVYSLRGELEQDYASDGLQSEIVIPLGKASVPG